MKITKEMLARLRDWAEWREAEAMSDDILALLDERKALREALKVCVPDGGAAKEMRDLALLGGEDEG